MVVVMSRRIAVALYCELALLKPEWAIDDDAARVLAQDAETATWLPGARLNIAESCFLAPADRPIAVPLYVLGALMEALARPSATV